MAHWTFITNHGAVLALIARHGQITAREIAQQLGITERSVLRIVRDLEDASYLRRSREGRVNWYNVDPSRPLRRPGTGAQAVGGLLDMLHSHGGEPDQDMDGGDPERWRLNAG